MEPQKRVGINSVELFRAGSQTSLRAQFFLDGADERNTGSLRDMRKDKHIVFRICGYFIDQHNFRSDMMVSILC